MAGIAVEADRQADAHPSEALPVSLTLKASFRLVATWLSLAAVVFLFGEVLYHSWGVLQDSLVALNYPFRLDYGEGIVWQQALLMFGSRMYSPSTELPFIVFHYPPLYHVIVRALLQFNIDPLFAGRLISGISTLAAGFLVTVLSLAGLRTRPNGVQCMLAISIGLMFLCFNPVRGWGIWMRVDMLAVALGLAATVAATTSRFSIVGMTTALLLSVACVFTKQTHLAAGVSIFVVGIICSGRNTLVSAFIAGAVGVICAALLELTTHGFFKNIITYNLNPVNWFGANYLLWSLRDNWPFAAAMGLAASITSVGFFRSENLQKLKHGDIKIVTQCILAIHFWLGCLTAVQVVKEGASSNYFLDFIGSGSALLGILLCEIARKPLRLAALTITLALTTSNLQYRRYFEEHLAITAAENRRLVKEIQASPKPVASDDMVVVLRAGKSLVFEPAIVRVLLASGAWNPSPLIQMIRNHEFSMILTDVRVAEAGPLIEQETSLNYPLASEATSVLIKHLPAIADQP